MYIYVSIYTNIWGTTENGTLKICVQYILFNVNKTKQQMITSLKRTPTALYYNIAVIQYLVVTVTDVG